jgi:hypothetical protein
MSALGIGVVPFNHSISQVLISEPLTVTSALGFIFCIASIYHASISISTIVEREPAEPIAAFVPLVFAAAIVVL